MLISRPPRPALRPFVKTVWVADQPVPPVPGAPARERVLPTGGMHLAIRLTGEPVRYLGHPADPEGRRLGYAVVGGARAGPYLREAPGPSRSVGAMLQPGASELLFGVPACELAERHTALEDLWERRASELRERLLEAGSPSRQLDLFESLLAARLPEVRGLHPAVAHALARFAAPDSLLPPVRAVVRETGYSHRRVIALFRSAVGLAPKLYCRVLRFQRALERIARDPRSGQVDAALEAGYSDQPHLVREFQAFAGITPGEYAAAPPRLPNHLPIRAKG
jgi:AraC-like DNA-binding protein